MGNKKKAALWSMFSNSLLIVLKLVVGLLSGSVSIISEAIHSTLDLLASTIAFIAVRFSDQKPDKDHPYGHEKAENISGVVEGILILGAAVWIIYEAIHKLLNPEPIKALYLGLAVMLFSSIVNFFVSRKLYQVAKKEDSVALEADALHLKADVYTSLGVCGGLLLIWLTGLTILDPIAAILVALLILKEAISLTKQAFQPLMDAKLSDEEEKTILSAIDQYKHLFLDMHDLRTRKAGKIRHIDFHLNFHKTMSLKEAHNICDLIEQEICRHFCHCRIIIHPEICPPHCSCEAANE